MCVILCQPTETEMLLYVFAHAHKTHTCFCMQAASKVVSERPLALLIPVVPLLLYTAVAIFWVWSTIYLFTICALSWLLTSYQSLSSRQSCRAPLAASLHKRRCTYRRRVLCVIAHLQGCHEAAFCS